MGRKRCRAVPRQQMLSTWGWHWRENCSSKFRFTSWDGICSNKGYGFQIWLFLFGHTIGCKGKDKRKCQWPKSLRFCYQDQWEVNLRRGWEVCQEFPLQCFRKFWVILYVHLKDPEERSDGENYAQNKFKDRNNRVSFLILELKIENFILLFESEVFSFVLS